jgi:hypothetical protein
MSSPGTAGEKAPNRLVRGKNALPDALRDLVGDRAIKRRAIRAPEGMPSMGILRPGRPYRKLHRFASSSCETRTPFTDVG